MFISAGLRVLPRAGAKLNRAPLNAHTHTHTQPVNKITNNVRITKTHNPAHAHTHNKSTNIHILTLVSVGWG